MKLIINADDFGMTQEINTAIYRAFENGWISSATLMAGAKFIGQAVEMSADIRDGSLGVHLALDGPFNVGSTGSRIVSEAKFRPDNVKRVKRFIPGLVSDIEDEFSRQIGKILDMGVAISHVDTHHHLHLYFPVLQGLVRAARKHGIRKARSLVLPVGQSFVKRAYRNLHHRYARFMGMKMPDCYCSFQQLEELPGRYFAEDSVVEIMCHPGLDGYNDEAFFNDEFFSRINRRNIINFNIL